MSVRAVLVAGLLIVGATPAHAQNADLKSLWRQVTSGDVVRVKEASGQETRGVFEKLSDSSVSLVVDGKSLDIPNAQVREIRRRGDSPKGGLFVGAMIGAGAMAALVYNCTPTATKTCTEPVRAAVYGAGIGAGIGAFIDQAVPGWTIAYRDNGTSFALAPVVLPTPRGTTAGVVIRVDGIF